MSTERTLYDVGDALPVMLKAFTNRACALPKTNNAYKEPTPEEVKTLIKLAGWSQTDTAKLTGVSFNPKKGSTTVRRWQTAKEKPEYRVIPYAAWRLMLISAGVVDQEEALKEIGLSYKDGQSINSSK